MSVLSLGKNWLGNGSVNHDLIPTFTKEMFVLFFNNWPESFSEPRAMTVGIQSQKAQSPLPENFMWSDF